MWILNVYKYLILRGSFDFLVSVISLIEMTFKNIPHIHTFSLAIVMLLASCIKFSGESGTSSSDLSNTQVTTPSYPLNFVNYKQIDLDSLVSHPNRYSKIIIKADRNSQKVVLVGDGKLGTHKIVTKNNDQQISLIKYKKNGHVITEVINE